MAQDVPEPWSTAMIAAGCVDPRRKDDVASMGQLAERAGLTTETVRRMIRGIGRPDPSSVLRVAEVLGDQVYEWAVLARYRGDGWQPPSEAAFLSREEGAAITELIRVMTSGRSGRRDDVAPPLTRDSTKRRARELRRDAYASLAKDAGLVVVSEQEAAYDQRPREGQAEFPAPGQSEDPHSG